MPFLSDIRLEALIHPHAPRRSDVSFCKVELGTVWSDGQNPWAAAGEAQAWGRWLVPSSAQKRGLCP